MEKKLSRQRIWSIKMQAKGLCPLCGKKTRGKFYCKEHNEMRNERDRARRIAIIGEVKS